MLSNASMLKCSINICNGKNALGGGGVKYTQSGNPVHFKPITQVFFLTQNVIIYDIKTSLTHLHMHQNKMTVSTHIWPYLKHSTCRFPTKHELYFSLSLAAPVVSQLYRLKKSKPQLQTLAGFQVLQHGHSG